MADVTFLAEYGDEFLDEAGVEAGRQDVDDLEQDLAQRRGRALGRAAPRRYRRRRRQPEQPLDVVAVLAVEHQLVVRYVRHRLLLQPTDGAAHLQTTTEHRSALGSVQRNGKIELDVILSSIVKRFFTT